VVRAFVPEPRPIVLGVAAWLALAGWRMLVPGVAIAIAHMRGGEPPFEMSTTATTVAAVLGYLAFVVPGYVTARAAARTPLYNAAALGVLVYLLSTLVELGLGIATHAPARFDVSEALAELSTIVVATLIGGTIASWHMRSRGAPRWGARVLSLRAAALLVVVALIPYALIVGAIAQ